MLMRHLSFAPVVFAIAAFAAPTGDVPQAHGGVGSKSRPTKAKPKASPAVGVPKLRRFLKPRVRAFEEPGQTAPAAAGNDPPPEPSVPPPLTAEQLAVDSVTITAELLHTPQVGVTLSGSVTSWGLDWHRGIHLGPSNRYLIFYAEVPWVGFKSLLVACTGRSLDGLKVTYGRYSRAKYAQEELGAMTFNLTDDTELKFVVPPSDIAGWERLFIELKDVDAEGGSAKIDGCTLTRL